MFVSTNPWKQVEGKHSEQENKNHSEAKTEKLKKKQTNKSLNNEKIN